MKEFSLQWQNEDPDFGYILSFDTNAGDLLIEENEEYDPDDDYTVELGIYKDVTWNCQLMSIGNFQAFFQTSMSREEIRHILLQIRMKTSKKQFLLDINQCHKTRLKELFSEEEIMFITPYVNGTGSKMMIVMVKPDLQPKN